MANVFWLSRAAARRGARPVSAAADPGTDHRVPAPRPRRAHQPVGIWQAGTLHVVQHAPRPRGRVIKPRADDFGENVVVFVGYVGLAVTTFMTPRNAETSLRGPGRTALKLASRGSNGSSRNTLRSLYHTNFLEGLPAALRISDQQQRGIAAAMAASDVPGHVIHALAGCGKSIVLQWLVALYAARHARMLDSEAGSHALAFVLRARTLRHEFLRTLLRNQTLQPGQVMFGGKGGGLPIVSWRPACSTRMRLFSTKSRWRCQGQATLWQCTKPRGRP